MTSITVRKKWGRLAIFYCGGDVLTYLPARVNFDGKASILCGGSETFACHNWMMKCNMWHYFMWGVGHLFTRAS